MSKEPERFFRFFGRCTGPKISASDLERPVHSPRIMLYSETHPADLALFTQGAVEPATSRSVRNRNESG